MEYDLETEFKDALKDVKSNSLKMKLVALKNLAMQRLSLENEFKLQSANLQTKYEAIYKPLYDKRSKVVNGEVDPAFNEDTKTWDEKEVTTDGTASVVENFWLKCIEHSKFFPKLINDKDRKVLKHLKNITIDGQQGFNFTVNFTFAANEFFDHPVLTKSFTMNEIKGSAEKIVSTSIEWKSEELNPGIEKKKKKIKKGKETKVITKVSEVPTFFGFFKSYDLKEMSKKENKEDDEDMEEQDPEDILDEELETAEQFRDEIIPYAIEYYLDVVGGEDDDMDFEEEEEDEEEDPKHKKHKKK